MHGRDRRARRGTDAARSATTTCATSKARVTLHQVLAPGVPEDFPPPRTLDATPTTLPAQRASFVGRGPDVATVRRLLFDRRLVTLTGPGGTGKTRLAIEIAGREQPHHPGGTFFADLASLEDGDHLAATVARACLISLDASRPTVDQLTDALASRNALVVLDNCEHVLDAVAEVADRVLALVPRGRAARDEPRAARTRGRAPLRRIATRHRTRLGGRGALRRARDCRRW